jgi:hypothetical protein
MQIALGQSQEFAERTGLLDDSKHGARRAMASQPAGAPLAFAARQIDLANHALADPSPVVRVDDFADKLVARRTAKAVITALQLEVGVANSTEEQADQRESRRAPGPGTLTHRYGAVLKTN